MKICRRVLVLCLIATAWSCSRSVDRVTTLSSGDIVVVLAAEGGRLKSGSNSIELTFQSGISAQTVAEPRLAFHMPAMGNMPAMVSTAELSSSNRAGVFKGNVDLEMKGTWHGLLEFSVGAEKRQVSFDISAL